LEQFGKIIKIFLQNKKMEYFAFSDEKNTPYLAEFKFRKKSDLILKPKNKQFLSKVIWEFI
jgi:hypothetical protein